MRRGGRQRQRRSYAGLEFRVRVATRVTNQGAIRCNVLMRVS